MAAQERRKQESRTAHVLVLIHTCPFRKGPQFARSITVTLFRHTSDTVSIVKATLAVLHTIYRPGYQLTKADVMLLDLHSARFRQGELELEPLDSLESSRERLMGVVDELNQRYGRGTVKLAAGGIEQPGERALGDAAGAQVTGVHDLLGGYVGGGGVRGRSGRRGVTDQVGKMRSVVSRFGHKQ